MALSRLFSRRPQLVAVLYLIAVPVAILVIAVAGAFDHFRSGRDIRRLAAEGAEAHRAICVFRTDLEQRVQAGYKLLADHPHGLFGIPAATIRNSLDNEQQTVDALSVIHCDPKGTP